MALETARFTARRGVAERIGQDQKLKRYLEGIAEEAADEVDRLLVHRNIFDGLEVRHGVDRTPDGYEAHVSIGGESASGSRTGWHFWEYGTVNHPAKPALRPGVQTVLSRHRGKFRTIRKGASR